MDVEIDEIVTELVVSDGATSLSREEMKKIIDAVLQHMRSEKDRDSQREKDTAVRDRAYRDEREQ